LHDLLGLISWSLAEPVLKYIPMQMPPGTAGQFLTALFISHFVYVVARRRSLVDCCCSSTLCATGSDDFGPVIVSILAYHLLMDPKGLPLAIIVTVFGSLRFPVQQNFSGIFAARPA